MAPIDWQELWAWRLAPGNALTFAVRRRLRWSRGEPELRGEPKAGLFDHLPRERRGAAARWADGVAGRHDLADLQARSTRRVWLENLALLSVLETAIDGIPLPAGDGPVRAADVGARNWSYATAQERLLRSWGAGTGRPDPVELTGIELDGHALAPDGRARVDHARAHAGLTGNPNVRYEVADVLEWPARDLDVVFLLFPFLTRYAVLRWGLPPHVLRPGAVVSKAFGMLRPGGVLVSLHQTGWEAEEMARLAVAGRPSGGPKLLREAAGAAAFLPWADRTERRRVQVWRASGRGGPKPALPAEVSPMGPQAAETADRGPS